MSVWNWIMRGCAASDVRPSCGTCGYGLDGVGLGGTCPECGMPFIAATVEHRGPMPRVEWHVLWTVVPLIALAGGWWAIIASDGEPLVLATVGGVALTLSLSHQVALRWFIHHTLSDIDRRRAGIWCLVTLWSIISGINGLIGIVLVPVGVLVAIFR